MDTCLEHSGHASRIKNLEGSQAGMKKDINAAHDRLDGMKNWVIAGMTALVLQLLLHIITLVSKTPAAPPVQ